MLRRSVPHLKCTILVPYTQDGLRGQGAWRPDGPLFREHLPSSRNPCFERSTRMKTGMPAAYVVSAGLWTWLPVTRTARWFAQTTPRPSSRRDAHLAREWGQLKTSASPDDGREVLAGGVDDADGVGEEGGVVGGADVARAAEGEALDELVEARRGVDVAGDAGGAWGSVAVAADEAEEDDGVFATGLGGDERLAPGFGVAAGGAVVFVADERDDEDGVVAQEAGVAAAGRVDGGR